MNADATLKAFTLNETFPTEQKYLSMARQKAPWRRSHQRGNQNSGLLEIFALKLIARM